MSWYFSLGDLKYSVAVSEDACSVSPGRPQGGSAVCVVKAEPDMIKSTDPRYLHPACGVCLRCHQDQCVSAPDRILWVFGLTDYKG